MLSKPDIHLLCLSSSIYDQLRLEEALLRLDHHNWCIVNMGSSPAIVMGISGKVESLINREFQDRHRIPIIRRFSGGGTVLVDHNTLFFTFICNTSCTQVACYPSHVFEWSEKIWRPVFQEVEFFLQENDYVIGNKKFGGNAQYMRKERWLHHSSFLWDFNEELMRCLKQPLKMPEYRVRRSHSDFLCKLKDFLPHPGLLQERLIVSLGKNFNLIHRSLKEVEDLLIQDHRKSTAYLEFYPPEAKREF